MKIFVKILSREVNFHNRLKLSPSFWQNITQKIQKQHLKKFVENLKSFKWKNDFENFEKTLNLRFFGKKWRNRFENIGKKSEIGKKSGSRLKIFKRG